MAQFSVKIIRLTGSVLGENQQAERKFGISSPARSLKIQIMSAVAMPSPKSNGANTSPTDPKRLNNPLQHTFGSVAQRCHQVCVLIPGN
jgi:hypothetical protein